MLGLVIGIPGVGKSSVITTARKYLNKEIEVINFGDICLALAKEKYGITHRDMIRKVLSKDEYKQLQIETARVIREMSEGKNVLIDTHFLIETPYGYFSGIPSYIAEILKPDIVIVIVAPPEQILERRKKDITRIREIESIERIKMHQELTLYYAAAVCFYTGCNLVVIENPDGKLEEAAKKFAEVINNL